MTNSGGALMPTSSQMNLPKTKSVGEFEEICVDVLNTLYNEKNFDIFGRRGQRQDGIDIIERGHASTDFTVAQCKNYFTKSTIKNFVNIVKNDVFTANEMFCNQNKIQLFIAMTSISRDSHIQAKAREITELNLRIMFWEDIQEVICSSNRLMKKYYPSFCIDNDMEISVTNRNMLIHNIGIIKYAIAKLRDNSNVRIGYDPAIDIPLYNYCVSIAISASELIKLREKLYIQLGKINANEHIDKIIKSLPEFYSEPQGGNGCKMIMTISNFFGYFSQDKNLKKYMAHCDAALNKIISL